MELPREIWDVQPGAAPAVVYFPVRHYSPASARLLWECARAIQPTAVLVEGPSEFNDRLDELRLDGHELPIALYAYARLSNDTQRSAFYPYCEYAPEWQAQLVASTFDVPFRFIDLPWPDMALETDRQHRYSDHNFRVNPYPAELCARMNVEDFDELWDVLFELEAEMSWQDYMRRAHEFCWHLRLFGGPDTIENQARETCMTSYIDAAVEEFGGPVLVVTGGFHSSGLWARRAGVELPIIELDEEPAPDEPLSPEQLVSGLLEPEEPPTIVDHGITLTPFTYGRIDKLSGYASGVHGPAFYQYVWERRQHSEPLDGRDFLYEIVDRLRERGQVASTADVIGIESTARALALLRGRSDIWRFDLLDAVSSALVKESQDAEYMHPVLQVARDVLRGAKRGHIDERAPLPPLVTSTRALLEKLGLTPVDEANHLNLEIEVADDRERSKVLHQCRVLGIAGFRFGGGTDFAEREDLSEIWEDWEIQWSPEHEATLIEASVYGSDLRQSAIAKALERASDEELDAEDAAKLAIDAVLMGAVALADSLIESLRENVRNDGDFFRVATALGHVLYLFGYDEVLGTQDDPLLSELMREVYLRALWLFESLGTVKERDAELIRAIRTLLGAFRRCYQSNTADADEFVAIFSRTAEDTAQTPLARGAAMGTLYTLGKLETDRVLATMRYFSDPMELGDFLIGFFSLAREAAQRDPRLLWLIDEVVCSLHSEEFLEMLPGMRLAFTYFTPREKHAIVDTLFGKSTQPDTHVDAQSRSEGGELESRIRQTAEIYGLRGVPDDLEPIDETTAATTEGEPTEPTDTAEESDAGDREAVHEPADDGMQPTSDLDEEGRKERWRLILGSEASDGLGGLGGEAAQQDRLLAYLYDREYGPKRNVRGQGGPGDRGSLDPSKLTVPDWINGVHELFPKRTIERLEKDALDRYQIEELVTRPDVLSRATPNPTLLKAVLRTKHLMNQEVLDLARNLVRQVVRELMEKLAREISQPFSGAVDRRRRSFVKVAKNFDARETIRRNLKHFDAGRQALVVHDPFFYSRIRRHADRWQVIIVVDQSGSMLDSVIHSAVTASIFRGVKALKTHLVAFDTNIVDLTAETDDPVETLMRVQLGGGTDIANALSYAQNLVENPRRTIVVLITDFFEGGPVKDLLAVTKSLVESGVNLLGLAALDEDANPNYDRETASAMVDLGAHVGAMTPGELANWVAEKVR